MIEIHSIPVASRPAEPSDQTGVMHTAAMEYLIRARAQYARSRFQEAIKDTQSAIELFHELQNISLLRQAQVLLADCCLQLDQYDKARLIAQSIKSDEISKIEDETEAATEAHLQSVLGFTELHQGNTELATEAAAQATTIAREFKLPALESKALRLHASIYLTLRQWDKVLQFSLQSLETAERSNDGASIAAALQSVGGAYIGFRNFDEARVYLFRAHTLFVKIEDLSGQALCQSNIGVTYYNERRYAEALPHLQRARELAHQIQQRHSEAIALGMIASVHLRAFNDAASAERDAREALTAARELGEMRLQEYLIKSLMEVLEAQERYAESLEYARELNKVSLQLLDKQRTKELDQLRSKVELMQEQHEKELHKLRAEQLQSDLDRSTAKLSVLSLQVINHNAVLDSVRTALSKVVEPAEARRFKPVFDLLETNERSQETWQTIEEQYLMLSGPMLNRLAGEYPLLSQMELRICALVRANLSSKEIARILCSSVRTVETHRLRIRRKLELQKDVALEQFLSTYT